VGTTATATSSPQKKDANNNSTAAPAVTERALRSTPPANEVVSAQSDAAEIDQTEAKTAPAPSPVADEALSPGKENVIVLQRSKMEEIVVGKSDAAATRAVISIREAEPIRGTVYFNDYLSENLHLPEAELLKNRKGELELSFQVNKTGEPINIAVEKSLCEACDQEAIRALREGPKWKQRSKTRRGRVKLILQ
jgi:hypothetical protein